MNKYIVYLFTMFVSIQVFSVNLNANCKELVPFGGGDINVGVDESSQEIHLYFKPPGEDIEPISIALPVAGADAKCTALKSFSNFSLVIVSVDTGNAGTQGQSRDFVDVAFLWDQRTKRWKREFTETTKTDENILLKRSIPTPGEQLVIMYMNVKDKTVNKYTYPPLKP